MHMSKWCDASCLQIPTLNKVSITGCQEDHPEKSNMPPFQGETLSAVVASMRIIYIHHAQTACYIDKYSTSPFLTWLIRKDLSGLILFDVEFTRRSRECDCLLSASVLVTRHHTESDKSTVLRNCAHLSLVVVWCTAAFVSRVSSFT